VVGRLAGEVVVPTWRVALAADAAVAPGCLDGRQTAVVFGDALLALSPSGVRSRLAVPATVGRCQVADADTVLYLAEDDHAVVTWSLPRGTAARGPLRCDDVSVDGGWLACVPPDGIPIVGRWTTSAAGAVSLADRAAGLADRPVTQVELTPDGSWLATVTGGGRLVLYRRDDDGTFRRAGDLLLRAGETLLGFEAPWE